MWTNHINNQFQDTIGIYIKIHYNFKTVHILLLKSIKNKNYNVKYFLKTQLVAENETSCIYLAYMFKSKINETPHFWIYCNKVDKKSQRKSCIPSLWTLGKCQCKYITKSHWKDITLHQQDINPSNNSTQQAIYPNTQLWMLYF